MAKPDFDTAAAHVIAIAFSSASAREIIAHVLEMTWLEGRGDGLASATEIIKSPTRAQEKTP